jgi:hypothetical protein
LQVAPAQPLKGLSQMVVILGYSVEMGIRDEMGDGRWERVKY